MRVKVQMKVTVDGQQVHKGKVVGDVTDFNSAVKLENRAQDALAGVATQLRNQGGLQY